MEKREEIEMSNPFELVKKIFCENMRNRYSGNEIQAACQIWENFTCNSSDFHVNKGNSWAAAVDFILNRLAIKFQPQKSICELYHVSATMLHSHFNAIQDSLKIIFFDARYPLKALGTQLEESTLMRIRLANILISDKRYSFIKSAEMARKTLLLDYIGKVLRTYLQYKIKKPLPRSNNPAAASKRKQILIKE